MKRHPPPATARLLPGLLGGQPEISPPVASGRFAKRLLDIVFSLVLGLVLAPVFLGLCLWLLLKEGGPVFYASERMRAPGRPFRLYKLRTMTPQATPTGDAAVVSGGHVANRITRTGAVLRRARLDELPQLWNILRGDMSFVGPRPPLRRYVEEFPELYAAVLSVRPGVTGMATLAFHAHEARVMDPCASVSEAEDVYRRRCVPRKARIDLIYARRQSLALDFKLVFETIGNLALRSRP